MLLANWLVLFRPNHFHVISQQMKLVGISSHFMFYLKAALSNTKNFLGTFSAF